MNIKHGYVTENIYDAIGYCCKIKISTAYFVAGAADLVLGPGVTLLRGKISDLLAVAELVKHKVKYQSTIFGWAHFEEPTLIQIGQVLNDYQFIAHAGLPHDRFCRCVFLHRVEERIDGIDVFRYDMHYLEAAIDLATLKAFKIAPPGWHEQKTYDALRDYYNARFNWSSPTDPSLARLVQPGRESAKVRAIRRAGTEEESLQGRTTDLEKSVLGGVKSPQEKKKYIKQEILIDLENQARSGLLKNREDVIMALERYGNFDPKKSDSNSVVIKLHALNRDVRFAGLLFNIDFEPSRIPKKTSMEDLRRRATQPDDEDWSDARRKTVLDSYEGMQTQWKKRREFNKSRFKQTLEKYPMEWACHDAKNVESCESIALAFTTLPADVQEQMRRAKCRAEEKELRESEEQKAAADAKRQAEEELAEAALARQMLRDAQEAEQAAMEAKEKEQLEADKAKKEMEGKAEKERAEKVQQEMVEKPNEKLEELLANIEAVKAGIGRRGARESSNTVESSKFRRL